MDIKSMDFIGMKFSPNDNPPPSTTIKVINKTTGETIREIPKSSKAYSAGNNLVDFYV